jgi:hypothetical protein
MKTGLAEKNPDIYSQLEPEPEQVEEWRGFMTDDLLRALARFNNHLEYAAALYELGEKETAARMNAYAAIEFVKSAPILNSPRNLAPLTLLLDAFNDVDDGITPALFTPEIQSGRPLDPTSERTFRGRVAGAMEVLMSLRPKYRKLEAAKFIADELRRLGFKIGDPRRSTEPAITVASWRDYARRKDQDPNSDHVSDMYSLFVKNIGPYARTVLSEHGRTAATKTVLTILAGLYPRNRANHGC